MRIEARCALLALCAIAAWPALAGAQSCPVGANGIDVTLTTGSRWELCWEEQPNAGIVFHEIVFDPPTGSARRMVKEASIAQIQVVYDDDRARRQVVTEDGLGGPALVELDATRCPGGTLLSNGVKNVLCQRTEGRGYVYKYQADQLQGYWLELLSVSDAGGMRWSARWRFYDDGRIEAALGSSGMLTQLGTDADFGWPVSASSGNVAVGFTANAWWRLDVAIGADGTDELAERIEVTPVGDGSTKSTSLTALPVEVGESVDAQLKRAWRVLDQSTVNGEGHPRSLEIDPLEVGQRYVPEASEAWAAFDVAVTRHDACERFASQNDAVTGCGGSDLAAFLDGESTNGADIVLWLRSTSHRLPRTEDHPFLGTRWQGVRLVPRDWNNLNPLSFQPPSFRTPAGARVLACTG